jgi:MFS transporter, DHA3 family, macrolide efflux protein
LQKPTVFGIAYGFITFISIFWSLYCGTLIDKYSRKILFLSLNISGALIMAIVTIIGYNLGYVPVGLILVAFASTVFIFNVHYPNLYAFGQEITRVENYGKINSYIEIQGQLTSIMAGAFAAILLSGNVSGKINLVGIPFDLPFTFEPFTLYEVFGINSITYIISLAFISMIRYTPINPRNPETGSIWKRLRSGFNYLKGNKYLFMFGLASYSIFVIILVNLFFLLPVYVNRHLNEGADVFASSEVMFALGAVLAGFGVPMLLRFMEPVKAIIINILVTVVIMVVYFYNTQLMVFYLVSLLLGTANAGTRIIRLTYIFSVVPNDLIGRVNSVFSVLNIIMRIAFIGLFSLPFFIQSDHIRFAYLIFGFFVLIAGAIMIAFYKKLRR